METKIESIYLTVRADVEVPEVDYSFKERDSEDRFKVVNTKICGRNMI